jgi:hypothetical protein
MKQLARVSLSLLFLFGVLCSPCAATEKIPSLCLLHYPSDHLIGFKCVRLTSKDSPWRVFGKHWQDGLRFNRMDRRHFVAGLSIKVPNRLKDIDGFNPMPVSYPAAAGDAKFILIDQSEMFLGAYEHGVLVFSTPVAVGSEGYRLQNGSYQVDAADLRHESSLYPVEGTDRPYPMHFGLRFFTDKKGEGWTSYWLHGRDVPGYPASHGCIGLYDEEMQRAYYHEPGRPVLKDARKLYSWVVGSKDHGKFLNLRHGPRVLITGSPAAADAVPLARLAAPLAIEPAARASLPRR